MIASATRARHLIGRSSAVSVMSPPPGFVVRGCRHVIITAAVKKTCRRLVIADAGSVCPRLPIQRLSHADRFCPRTEIEVVPIKSVFLGLCSVP